MITMGGPSAALPPAELRSPIPLRDRIACVARECALRRNVYPKWVASSGETAFRPCRMTADEAGRELARMEAVLATLQELEMGAADEPQGGLR